MPRRDAGRRRKSARRKDQHDICAASSATSATSRSLPVLIDGLRRLEYRGYDSAGVAVVRDGAIELRRSAGKLASLEEALAIEPARRASTASATRAGPRTAGPTEENAHPHRDCTGRIVVVHNGIIENYLELKRQLQQRRAHASSPRPTPRSSRTWSSARSQRATALENAVRRALLVHARAVRARADLGRRSRQDRRRAQRPAARRRPRRRRVLRRLGHPGDPQPHARRRVPRRRRDGGAHAGRRRVHRLRRRRARRRRTRVSPGIRSWPRRPATSTSCSRRSSSSRGR